MEFDKKISKHLFIHIYKIYTYNYSKPIRRRFLFHALFINEKRSITNKNEIPRIPNYKIR